MHRTTTSASRHPRIRIAGTVLLGLACVSSSFDASATRWFVQSGGAQVAFSPQFLTIQAGDTVTFLNLGGYHNVVADDGSFRCAHGCDGDGSGGSGNASDSFWIASVTFANAGTVGYFCEPHGSPGSGMYGAIDVVAPPPPAPIVPAPGGSATINAILAFGVGVIAALRLRRRARIRAAG